MRLTQRIQTKRPSTSYTRTCPLRTPRSTCMIIVNHFMRTPVRTHTSTVCEHVLHKPAAALRCAHKLAITCALSSRRICITDTPAHTHTHTNNTLTRFANAALRHTLQQQQQQQHQRYTHSVHIGDTVDAFPPNRTV